MGEEQRRLVVIGCSATKRKVDGSLPAVSLYDGPMYRVLRAFLREFHWPHDLSLAVLSAKHGLMGGLTPIENYNRRMTRTRVTAIESSVRQTLEGWQPQHTNVELVLGQDYLPAIETPARNLWQNQTRVARGAIGLKLRRFRNILRKTAKRTTQIADDAPRAHGRPVYFLPDWDDFVDVDYDFSRDRFSNAVRADRNEIHCSRLVRPRRLADGILVSLAQSQTGKGLLRSLEASSFDSLAPKSVKEHFGLADDQWAFGDCGAFSYVNEDEPTISVDQAIAIYELFGFDLGASVDHIPVPYITRDGKRRKLKKFEQEERIDITIDNAERFMEEWRRRECRFHPVGVVQGLTPQDYAKCTLDYVEMGYRRIALGGLVPRSDAEIREIVRAVSAELRSLDRDIWLHLMGVFRPKIQQDLRKFRVDSFDSATYFRKAWLRSEQNYLAADGEWYAAIRVPPSSDPRTAQRLAESSESDATIKKLERAAMSALRQYGRRRMSLKRCLKAVRAYDRLLQRPEIEKKSFAAAYQRTLAHRPWERCDCGVCRKIGINALIFRGLNRNKRRGAHNTLMLYRGLLRTPARPAT